MKVKVLSRNPDDYLRETKRDIQKGELNIFSFRAYVYIFFAKFSKLRICIFK